MAFPVSTTFYLTLFVETSKRRSGIRPVASIEIDELDVKTKPNPARVNEEMYVNTENIHLDIEQESDETEAVSHFELIYPTGEIHTIDWDDGPWFESKFGEADTFSMDEYDRVAFTKGELRFPENP